MTVCALCGFRDPISQTDWDGRMVPACGVCLDPPSVPPDWTYEPVDFESREFGKPESWQASAFAVMSVMRRLGTARTRDVAGELGISLSENDPESLRRYRVLIKNLQRLVSRGELTASPVTPGKPRAGFIYEVASLSDREEAA
jgi:hypothetical protein